MNTYNNENSNFKKVMQCFLYSITFLLSVAFPIIGKAILTNPKEIAYENSIVALFHNNSPHFLYSISHVIAIIFSTKCCILILVLLALASLYIHKNYKITIVQLLISLLPMIYVFAVKFAVHRNRPNIGISVQLPPDPSFPSGHTAAAVAICTMIMLIVYLKKPTFLQSGLFISGFVVIIVAISRLIVAAHFPTDVLTSAIIYPLLATTIFYMFQKRGLYESIKINKINGSDILNKVENNEVENNEVENTSEK